MKFICRIKLHHAILKSWQINIDYILLYTLCAHWIVIIALLWARLNSMKIQLNKQQNMWLLTKKWLFHSNWLSLLSVNQKSAFSARQKILYINFLLIFSKQILFRKMYTTNTQKLSLYLKFILNKHYSIIILLITIIININRKQKC